MPSLADSAIQLEAPASRAEARAAGLNWYYTGDPCSRGHVAKRYVLSRRCVECVATVYRSGKVDYDAAYYKKNKELICERVRQYRNSNRDRVAKTKAVWAAKNADKTKAASVRYYYRNLDNSRARSRARYAKNKDAFRVYWVTRRARKTSALGMFSKKDIKSIFAQQRGKCVWCSKSILRGYHVDHILSLSRGGANHRRNLSFCVLIAT
jgi:hypothetical protein